MNLVSAWAWLNAALESTTFKLLIVPGALALIGLTRYFGRRKVEGTGESEEIRRTRELVDLQRAMNEGNVSMEQLNDLRQRLLGKPATQAVATATYFIERAEYLRERPGPALADEGAELTQLEMNQQAATRFHQADDELRSLLVKRMADSSQEEAASLQAAHDAWLHWRTAEADWEARTWEGGTIRPLLVATKLEALTRERIAALAVGQSLEQDPRNLVVVHKKAPRDLPEYLEPGVTSARVRELIGEPHLISGNYWVYRFQEVQVELFFEDDVLREVTFALIERYEASLGGVDDFTFGELTFGDLLAEMPDSQISSRSSSRTHEIYVELPVGLPGVHRFFFFGAIMPFHGTRLLHTEFDWDFENQRLTGDLSRTIVNWFGASNRFGEDEAPGASWYIK